MKFVLILTLVFNSGLSPMALARVEREEHEKRGEKPVSQQKAQANSAKKPQGKSAEKKANSAREQIRTKPAAKLSATNKTSAAPKKPAETKNANPPIVVLTPLVNSSVVASDDDDEEGEEEGEEQKPTAANATTESSVKTKVEDEEDDEGVGDPYLRYETSKLKDQNCDPTILEKFYRKSDYLGCITLGTAYCIQPTVDDLTWGFYGAAGGTVAGANAALDERKLSRKKVLKELDRKARSEASFTRKFLNGKSSKALGAMARPLFVLEREAGVARAVGGVVVRGGMRGAVYGFAGGLGVAAGMLVLDHALTKAVASTACSERDELDPNFRKYVPLEKGTCHTPIYTIGAPQVRDFMELPLKKKLEALDSNPRICGFYRSMNEELDKRIAELEGGSAVGKVTCEKGKGDITFSVRNDSKRKYTIKRKPESGELTSFEYALQAAPGVATESAVFDLVKTDLGMELSKIEFSNAAKDKKTVPYDEFPKFYKAHPESSQKIVHAFRTTRKHVPQLISCCDKSEKDLADKKGRHDCPSEWFTPKDKGDATVKPAAKSSI